MYFFYLKDCPHFQMVSILEFAVSMKIPNLSTADITLHVLRLKFGTKDVVTQCRSQLSCRDYYLVISLSTVR